MWINNKQRIFIDFFMKTLSLYCFISRSTVLIRRRKDFHCKICTLRISHTLNPTSCVSKDGITLTSIQFPCTWRRLYLQIARVTVACTWYVKRRSLVAKKEIGARLRARTQQSPSINSSRSYTVICIIAEVCFVQYYLRYKTNSWCCHNRRIAHKKSLANFPQLRRREENDFDLMKSLRIEGKWISHLTERIFGWWQPNSEIQSTRPD